MKQAAGVIAELTSEQIQSILEGTKLTIEVEGKSVELDTEKVIVERFEKDDLKVLNEGTLTVGLDSKVTDELKKEGYVRLLTLGILQFIAYARLMQIGNVLADDIVLA